MFAYGDVFNCADGDVGCLIDAIDVANANGEDDTIELAPGGAYTLTAPNPAGGSSGPTGLPAINSVITIVGRGATIARSTDMATPDFRILYVDSNGHLILNEVSVRYGRATGVSPAQDGGGIRVGRGATMNVVASVISDNFSSFLGGGVFVDVDGMLVLNQSAVLDNQAVDGGGVFLVKALVEVEDSVIAGNTADFGGGIFNDNGGVTHVVGSSISRNTASRWGGGIGNFSFGSGPDFGTRLTIVDTTLSENSGGDGGAIYSNTGSAQVTASTISDNHSDYGGSGISNKTGRASFSLNDSCIVGNKKTQFGEASVFNDPASPAMNATDNWWGAADGPSGVGPGSGDAVSSNVDFEPFRNAPAPACSATIVAIDVKPDSADNVVNPRSRGRFWLAILSDQGFDALQADLDTVKVGAGEATADRYKVRDANYDGLTDLVLRFRMQEVGISCGDSEIQLTGMTYDGMEIVGADDIRTTGCKRPKSKKKGK
jgi:hypothetical protein